MSSKYGDDEEEEEDLGVPVTSRSNSEASSVGKGAKAKKARLQPKKKAGKKGQGPAKMTSLTLDEKWTKFFKNFKTKLETEQGRKQLMSRIKKYKKAESKPEIVARLVKLFKFVKQDKRDKVLLLIPKFKRMLTKTS